MLHLPHNASGNERSRIFAATKRHQRRNQRGKQDRGPRRRQQEEKEEQQAIQRLPQRTRPVLPRRTPLRRDRRTLQAGRTAVDRTPPRSRDRSRRHRPSRVRRRERRRQSAGRGAVASAPHGIDVARIAGERERGGTGRSVVPLPSEFVQQREQSDDTHVEFPRGVGERRVRGERVPQGTERGEDERAELRGVGRGQGVVQGISSREEEGVEEASQGGGAGEQCPGESAGCRHCDEDSFERDEDRGGFYDTQGIRREEEGEAMGA
mmetsp:Transcript_38257/g.80231  ORF Transcript_38257/g.80231 Transcript_38257/m.80231 type:complete len:265 (+) Transcript_38257:1515-2309(+)